MKSVPKTNNTVVKDQFRQIGKITMAFCVLVRVISIALLVLALIGIAGIYAGFEIGSVFSGVIANATLVEMADAAIDKEAFPVRELDVTNLFAFALSQVVLLAFISGLSGLVRDITENEKPFRAETAKQLRRNTFWIVF